MKYRLRKQLTYALILTIAIISLIYGLILYPFEKNRIDTYTDKIEISLDTFVELRKNAIANEIFLQNNDGLRLVLRRIADFEGILVVGAYDQSGRFLGSSNDRAMPELSDGKSKSGEKGYVTYNSEFDQKAVLVFVKPIKVIGEDHGYIKIIYSLDDVLRQTNISILYFVALLLTIMLVLALTINYTIIRMVTKPLKVLAGAMEKAKSGELGVQADIKVENEIGGIADVFNTMSREQAEMYRQLDEANVSLEKKVLERTEELNDKNESLNRALAELERRNRELETALAEIKTLRGFIPICSNCKNIRDDEGYWKKIDEYIQEHSEAVFSHGLCPKCIKELYPDIADSVLERLKS